MGKKTQKTTSEKTQTPIEPAEYGPLGDKLRQIALARLQGGGLPAGYEEGGLDKISDAYRSIQRNLGDRLTARGIGRSPIAGQAMLQSELGRAGDVGRFRRELPLLERQLATQDFALGQGLFDRRPLGQRSEGEQTTVQSQDALSSLGTMLGMLMGSGGLSGPISGMRKKFGGGGGGGGGEGYFNGGGGFGGGGGGGFGGGGGGGGILSLPGISGPTWTGGEFSLGVEGWGKP